MKKNNKNNQNNKLCNQVRLKPVCAATETSKNLGILDLVNEPPNDKTNKMAWARSEVSEQPGHPPSLIT